MTSLTFEIPSPLTLKNNPRITAFGYNRNAMKKQKKFKPIANGNVFDSGIITLTESHFHVEKSLKDNESLNVNLEKKKPINCCFYLNITKHKLTAYLILLWHFFSYLCKYLNRY